MLDFQVESVAHERTDARRGVRVDIGLVGPSGGFEMDIRIVIPGREEFSSTRHINFVDGKARLIMTPFSRQRGAEEGVIFLRIDGQELPPISIGGRRD